MKKSLIKVLLIGCISLLIIIPTDKVMAVDKSIIDPNDKISIPSMIWNTGSKVNIYDTDDYDLYYEWLEISMDKYDEIQAIRQKNDDLVSEAEDYIEKNRPNKDDYDTIEEYNLQVEKVNEKVDEYNRQIEEIQDEYYAAIPDYDDTIWEKTSDDNVYLPDEAFSGTKPFIIYVKLVDHVDNTTAYEFAILQLDGEEVKDENIEDDESNIENPKTGDVTMEIFAIVLLTTLSISIIAYRRSRAS